LSQNDYFAKIKIRLWHNIFVSFGIFGIFTLPKIQLFYENFHEINWNFWLPKMPKWTQNLPIFGIFGLIWNQFRSTQLKIWPGTHYCSQFDLIALIRSRQFDCVNWIALIRLCWFDCVNLIASIRSRRFDHVDWIKLIWLQKWLPGQILSSLDLNWVQIRPKMADWVIVDCFILYFR